jgi:hypothetical protein
MKLKARRWTDLGSEMAMQELSRSPRHMAGWELGGSVTSVVLE